MLDYDQGKAGTVLDGTDPVAGALVDEGTHIQPLYRDEPAFQPQPEPIPSQDQAPTPEPTTTQEPKHDTEPTSNSEPVPSPAPDSAPNRNTTPTDQTSLLQQALVDAGTNYQIKQVLSTHPSNDGTDYTLLCTDDTGTHNVVIHIDGTSDAKGSLVSVTPAEG